MKYISYLKLIIFNGIIKYRNSMNITNCTSFFNERAFCFTSATDEPNSWMNKEQSYKVPVLGQNRTVCNYIFKLL